MSRDGQAIFFLVAVLMGLGTVMLFSVAGPPEGPVHPLFARHLLYVALGTLCAFLVYRADPQLLIRYGHLALYGVCFLCVLVFVPGVGLRVRGAARWVALGPIRLQPSELAKMALILYAARLSSDPPQTLKVLVKALLPVALLVVLVFGEPDLGTAAFLAFCGGLFVWFAGARLRHLALLGAISAALMGPVALLKFEHVRQRLSVFLDHEEDPLGRGYQLRQSLIAIGSGGPLGKGLGASEQKLFFLPDRNTDFIYAILAEETGLLGSVGVVALFVGWLVFGLRIARRLDDVPRRVAASSVALMLPMQAAINIGVVTGLLPTKGIPLPFLSFGGSSLVVSLALAGFLLRLDREGEGCGLSLRVAEAAAT